MKTELVVFRQLKEKVQSFSNILKLDTFAKKLGRKLALKINEIIAIGLFKHQAQVATKKSVYELLELQTHCSYKTLVVNLNRFYYLALIILALMLKANRALAHIIKHTDATDLPVGLNKNAKYHKTMRGLASWGHSGKGYYYGLKMHLTTDLNRKILAVRFTSANIDDREIFLKLNHTLAGLFVADAGYVSQALEQAFNREGFRRVLIASRKNMKKMATAFDIWVYRTRMLIELSFRSLKMFYGLITSLPRSVDGYLANYTYSLLTYVIA